MNFLKKIFLLFITFSVIASSPLILLGCLIALPTKTEEVTEKINEDILSLQALDLEDITKYNLCLKIEQSYPTIEKESSLPIEYIEEINESIYDLIEKLGFQIVTEDYPCEAALTITLTSYPLGGFYFPAVYFYTGAKVEGQIILTLPEQEQITVPISAEYPRTSMLDIIASYFPDEPSQAPFYHVGPEALLNGLAAIFGPQVYIKSLGAKAGYFRHHAERALIKIGEPVVELLIEALKDTDKNIREIAAEALGEIGDVRAVDPLINALKDGDSFVRGYAAEALGKIGDERAIGSLTKALNDKSSFVWEKAKEALEKIKAKQE